MFFLVYPDLKLKFDKSTIRTKVQVRTKIDNDHLRTDLQR